VQLDITTATRACISVARIKDTIILGGNNIHQV
jgi:hypothetical protein